MRADFGIFCSFHKSDSGEVFIYKKPKQIFLEVAGLSNDEKYSAALSKKIKIAKENKIPLLIVDFTTPQDNSSRQSSAQAPQSSQASQASQAPQSSAHSIFDFDYLSNIFTELYYGGRKASGEIILPYEV